MSKKKQWSSSAKFEIALQALKGDCTINELCTRHQVAPSQVHAWKKQFLEQGKEVFDKKRAEATNKAMAKTEQKQRQLYEKIGQLTVERDFLKKNWEKFQGSSEDDY